MDISGKISMTFPTISIFAMLLTLNLITFQKNISFYIPSIYLIFINNLRVWKILFLKYRKLKKRKTLKIPLRQ